VNPIMKILLITKWKHAAEITGANKAFYALASALARHHKVTALSLTQTGGNPFFEVSPRVHLLTLNGCYDLQKRNLHKFLRLFRVTKEKRHRYDQEVEDPLWAQRIRPVLDREKPDLIIAFSPDLVRILLFTIKTACPIILTLRQSADVLLTPLGPKDRETLENAACVHVLRPEEVNKVQAKAPKSRVIYIPNGAFPSGRKSTLDNPIIIHAGRFSEHQKRQHLLIEAFQELQQEFPDWQVQLWGEGNESDPYVKHCHDLVNQYHLEKKIRFCGVTDQMAEKMEKASVFAFPSSTEGMSQALLEAMEIGLPPVGFKSCPSVSSIIQDGVNGLLCEDGLESFAAALRRLMSHPELRKKLGSNACKVRDTYNPEHIWSEWENLVNTVFAESSQPNHQYPAL
jgi:glycosyltransferase involved in cell wall biosynthesis